MKINDVIRQVKTFYPSEFDIMELYIFCNEVSAMLAVEDRVSIHEASLPVADDGTVLLPEYVRFENIKKVYDGRRELTKECIRERRLSLPPRDSPIRPAHVRVVYEAPYEPIRLVKYFGEMNVDAENNTLSIYHSEFIPGDTLLLTIENEEYGGIHILGIEPDPENPETWILHTGSGELDSVAETHSEKAELQRYVTDDTLCDAPFDSMYVDYLLAKINLYQDNNTKYNTFMTSFNSKLSAYKKWLVGRMPSEGSVFKNWW